MTDLDKIAGAIVVAAGLIAWALVSQPVPRASEVGRYSFSVTGDWIRRFDSETGEVLLCNKQRCIAANEDGERDAYPTNVNWLSDEALNRL